MCKVSGDYSQYDWDGEAESGVDLAETRVALGLDVEWGRSTIWEFQHPIVGLMAQYKFYADFDAIQPKVREGFMANLLSAIPIVGKATNKHTGNPVQSHIAMKLPVDDMGLFVEDEPFSQTILNVRTLFESGLETMLATMPKELSLDYQDCTKYDKDGTPKGTRHTNTKTHWVVINFVLTASQAKTRTAHSVVVPSLLR